MIGKELISALEREGFAIRRRSKAYVWIGRGDDVLLVDEEAEVSDEVAAQLIARARAAAAKTP
jgi:hypothetical protein